MNKLYNRNLWWYDGAMINRVRCWLGYPKYVYIDPTGGDPALGGPVLIAVCVNCGTQMGAH